MNIKLYDILQDISSGEYYFVISECLLIDKLGNILGIKHESISNLKLISRRNFHLLINIDNSDILSLYQHSDEVWLKLQKYVQLPNGDNMYKFLLFDNSEYKKLVKMCRNKYPRGYLRKIRNNIIYQINLFKYLTGYDSTYKLLG